jgi:periplasmic protein TonB
VKVSPNTQVKDPSASAPAVTTPYRAAFPARALIALTHDAALLAILKRLSDGHPLYPVGSEVDLSSALLAQNPGVAVLDCAALATDVAALAQRLHGQFPELVLIVAGSADEQGLLASHITDGSVHRFLHKPFSEQRVRLFVESAWKRQEQVDALPEIRAPARLAPRRSSSSRGWLVLALVLAVAAAAGAFVLKMMAAAHVTAASATPPLDSALAGLLMRADQALAAGHLVTPAGDNAAELYRAALTRSAEDPRALNGLEQVIERLLGSADQALQQHQLDVAQQFVDAARALNPSHPRVAFLAAEIGAQRERAVLSRVQRAAAGGNVAGALAALGDAAHPGDAATLPTPTAAAADGPPAPGSAPLAPSATPGSTAAATPAATSGVADYLARASAALSRGQLIEPVEDNARFYIAAAHALAPDDPDVQAAVLDLIARLLSEARQAVAGKNAEQAEIWTTAAADAGADPVQIEALHQQIVGLHSAATADVLAQQAASFRQRLEQGHVLEPGTDSAKFYLAQLTQTDPGSSVAQQARSAYAQRALEEARGALASQDLAHAGLWLTEARAAGADAAELRTLDDSLSAAQSPSQPPDSIVNESTLTRTHYVAPRYPEAASQHALGGWVDLQFLVGTDGTVSDEKVVGAQPAGMFEQAALEAVREWRYQAVMRAGQAVSQRAQVRVRFAVPP